MDYAIIRHSKLKSYGAIAAVFQHNARLKTEPNVDPNRSGLNRLIDGTSHPVPATHGWLNGRVRERLRECEIELGKKDTVLAIEVLMATSPEWWDVQGPEGSIERKKAGKAWMEENIRYLNERFGPENVLCISLHMDEKTPHMHAVVTPIMMKVDRRKKDKTPKPTLCAKDFLGNDRKGLSDISQAYGKRFDHLNLRPGLPTDKRKKPMKHMPIKAHHELMRIKRESLEHLIEEKREEKIATHQMALAIREIITFVAQGDLFKDSDGYLSGTDKALAALKNAPDEVGQRTFIEVAEIVWNHIDKATADTREVMNKALVKILDDEQDAAKLVEKAEADHKAAEEAKNAAQTMQKANERQASEIQRANAALTQRLLDAKPDLDAANAVKADRKAAEEEKAVAQAIREANERQASEIQRTNAALTQRLLDAKPDLDAANAVKADRKAAEEAALAAKKDREAAAFAYQAIESRVTVANAAEEAARMERTAADTRIKAAAEAESKMCQREAAVEAGKISNAQKSAELKRQEADIQNKLDRAEQDRLAAQNDRVTLKAFLVGIDAFHTGKICSAAGSEKEKRIKFSPKLSDDERNLLKIDVNPAWDRIWAYVKEQTERFQFVDRLIEQAKAEVQRWQSLCFEGMMAISNLPSTLQAAPEVLETEKIFSEPQVDDDYSRLVSQWGEYKGGRGR